MNFNDLIGKRFAPDVDNAYGPDSYSCYGLLWEVYRRFGIDIPKVNISVTACKQASNDEIAKQTTHNWKPIEQPEVPCAVLIKSTHPDYANHVGVYIGKGKMIHITINRNVVVDPLDSWKHKILGYYRYSG